MFKKILSEIGAILIAVTAFILGAIMIPIGFLYNLGKPFYDSKGKPFKERMKAFVMWFLKLLYQIWVTVKKTFFYFGYLVDLLGNAVVGELIEDIVTHEEDTLFGRGDITISAALGHLKRDEKLNKTGLWLCKVLDFFDINHKDHCLNAIELYEFKQSQT
jgi:hypothetical protein